MVIILSHHLGLCIGERLIQLSYKIYAKFLHQVMGLKYVLNDVALNKTNCTLGNGQSQQIYSIIVMMPHYLRHYLRQKV